MDQDFFDEYQLEGFIAGWDNAVRRLGNRIAHKRSPIPGTMRSYERGENAAMQANELPKQRKTRRTGRVNWNS